MNNLITPRMACCVCGEEFQPHDDYDFVCRSCQTSLQGHCKCGSDDVVMDWEVDVESKHPYYWIIECVCGNSMKTESHGLNDVNKFAKELHTKWCAELPA